MSRGFSLLEAIVTLAIVGLLGATVWVLYLPVASRHGAKAHEIGERIEIDAAFDLIGQLLFFAHGGAAVSGNGNYIDIVSRGPLVMGGTSGTYRILSEGRALVVRGREIGAEPIVNNIRQFEVAYVAREKSGLAKRSVWPASSVGLEGIEITIAAAMYRRTESFSVQPLTARVCVDRPASAECKS